MEIFNAQNSDMFFKLFMAMILGTVIGLERLLAKKPAGMRTYSLVSMGAALFVIISEMVAKNYHLIGTSSFDPLRMASQVVVGVGFLGAGLIIFQDSKIVGLTTASSLWVAAGIGVSAGYGLYSLAVISTVLTLIIFTVFWSVEQKVRKMFASRYNHDEDSNFS